MADPACDSKGGVVNWKPSQQETVGPLWMTPTAIKNSSIRITLIADSVMMWFRFHGNMIGLPDGLAVQKYVVVFVVFILIAGAL